MLLAIEILQKKFPQVDYFPAYEIQMDELRDYRFYAADMLHPSDVAVDYIWSRFSENYFDQTTLGIMKELERLSAGLAHRPMHPESMEFYKFQQKMNEQKINIMTKYPFLSDQLG